MALFLVTMQEINGDKLPVLFSEQIPTVNTPYVRRIGMQMLSQKRNGAKKLSLCTLCALRQIFFFQ